MAVYPRLDESVGLVLKAVLMTSEGKLEYLNSPECPYSDVLKQHLRLMFKGYGVSESGTGSGGGGGGVTEPVRIFNVDENDKYDVVLSEIEATIEELKGVEQRIVDKGGAIDQGDQIQLIKAKTSLLEKWISQKERVYSLKEIIEFQSIVVTFMTDILDKDQVALFRKRLSSLRSSPLGSGSGSGSGSGL
jgi:hypothetical protein